MQWPKGHFGSMSSYQNYRCSKCRSAGWVKPLRLVSPPASGANVRRDVRFPAASEVSDERPIRYDRQLF